jgi:hypothetical protein
LSRLRRPIKPLILLLAFAGLAAVLSGCLYFKANSLAVSQPGGIGAARVHFAFCTDPVPDCQPVEEDAVVQYLLGIAVPPGSTPPQTITATPLKGGAPIVFTLNEEVAKEMAAASPSIQKFLDEEGAKPEERQLVGAPWPPSGLQGVGYLSPAVQEVKGSNLEWSVDADFGLPANADGSAFSGPFAAAIALGFRGIAPGSPESRPVHCARAEGSNPEDSAFCLGTNQQQQAGTSDLRIAAPAKSTGVFVGGKAPVSFGLSFASTAPTPPAIAYSATTTLKGAKATANAKGQVTVTVPNKAKPGTYEVTLTGTAQVPNGASSSATAKFKVTKPKIKLGAVKLNKAKGTATLSVKVPSAGTLTATGKGIVKAKKKAKKAKKLTITIKAKGATKSELESSGKAKVKAKISFKPSSGIAVKKSKSITLKQS